MLKVGYIGLGLMGKSIARNILKAGFPLIVHNRSSHAVDELVADGAQAASSPSEVASQVDVIFTNLPDTPDVEKVVLGESGIASAAHPGLIWVDNSTIKPATCPHPGCKAGGDGCPFPGCPGFRRGRWRPSWHACHHGRGSGRCAG